MSLERGWCLEGCLVDGAPVRLVFGDTQLRKAHLGLTVGRDEGLSELPVDDPTICPRHFRLSHGAHVDPAHRPAGNVDGSLAIEDLNSLNGTWVEERPLSPFHLSPLSPGERISVGRLVLTIRRIEAEG